MLLTFVMLWAYCAFSQYLLIWSGNLREEITWYLRRESGGWGWIAIALIVFHFFLPFMLLLSRQVKERSLLLFSVVVIVLALRFVDIYWFVAPAFSPFHFTISWLDFVLPVGIGGLWLAFFTLQLARRPLLPLRDPYAEEALNAEE
jgi:asparagine N-glycosylation enzyme membrane subunit Stt3